jgi:hypothetical protein
VQLPLKRADHIRGIRHAASALCHAASCQHFSYVSSGARLLELDLERSQLGAEVRGLELDIGQLLLGGLACSDRARGEVSARAAGCQTHFPLRFCASPQRNAGMLLQALLLLPGSWVLECP